MKKFKLDFIFIAGAPGAGKSSVANQLQKKLNSPCFEFGWIPEFRQRGGKQIGYQEEVGIAFENLVLVLKNYVKHGFGNIVVTDLDDKRILELHQYFKKYRYALFTLTVGNDGLLKSRILNQSRSSKYRDWKIGLNINKKIAKRLLLPKEVRIDTTKMSIQNVVKQILKYV